MDLIYDVRLPDDPDGNEHHGMTAAQADALEERGLVRRTSIVIQYELFTPLDEMDVRAELYGKSD